MKIKTFIMLAAAIFLITASGCSVPGNSDGKGQNQKQKHKIVVNVCDKNTDKPIADARVYVVGDDTCYTTDVIGNTEEINVDVNKAYFNRYSEQVVKEIGNGYVDVIVIKDGYAKHIELDHSVYPGDFPSAIYIELEQAQKDMYSLKQNYPDKDYVEKMMNEYGRWEVSEAQTQGDTNYVVEVKNMNGIALANAHVVIPEMGISDYTTDDGTYTFMAASSMVKDDYPVKKTYNEITILVYMEGYSSKAIFRVPVSSDSENNKTEVVLSSTDTDSIDEETIVPDTQWIEAMVNYYNK